MMSPSAVRLCVAYVISAVLAAGAGFGFMAFPALNMLSGDGANPVSDLGFGVLLVLGVLAVFQLAFGLMTGNGRGLLYRPVAPLVLATALGGGWLLSLTPLDEGPRINGLDGYGHAFIDMLQQAAVIAWVSLALTLIAGLAVALSEASRSRGDIS